MKLLCYITVINRLAVCSFIIPKGAFTHLNHGKQECNWIVKPALQASKLTEPNLQRHKHSGR